MCDGRDCTCAPAGAAASETRATQSFGGVRSSLPLDFLPPIQPTLTLLLEPAFLRTVVLAPFEVLWQARRAGERIGFVVGVLIALAVREVFHEFRRRGPEMQGHGCGDIVMRMLGGPVIGLVDRIALRSGR